MWDVDVSIIVPVYMHEKYVAQALDSIIAQKTSYSYEILVGEDCSPDGCREIIKKYEQKYPEKFRVWYREKNLNFQNGYELMISARGRYISVLEGDDFWTDENKLQRQIDFLETHPQYLGVACNFQTVDESGKVLEPQCIPDAEADKEFTWLDFLHKGFVFQTATFAYRNFFKDGQEYPILYQGGGDESIFTILLNKGNIYILPDNMSAYRKVRKKGGTNACSVALSDRGMSILRTCKIYESLRPYLRNSKDYNEKIAYYKAYFYVQMRLGHDTFTKERWEELKQVGDSSTNQQAIRIALKMGASRLIHGNKLINTRTQA